MKINKKISLLSSVFICLHSLVWADMSKNIATVDVFNASGSTIIISVDGSNDTCASTNPTIDNRANTLTIKPGNYSEFSFKRTSLDCRGGWPWIKFNVTAIVNPSSQSHVAQFSVMAENFHGENPFSKIDEYDPVAWAWSNDGFSYFGQYFKIYYSAPVVLPDSSLAFGFTMTNNKN